MFLLRIQKFNQVKKATEALSYSLNLKISWGGVWSHTTYNAVHYMHKKNCASRMAAPTPHSCYICVPPLPFTLCIHLCINVSFPLYSQTRAFGQVHPNINECLQCFCYPAIEKNENTCTECIVITHFKAFK